MADSADVSAAIATAMRAAQNIAAGMPGAPEAKRIRTDMVEEKIFIPVEDHPDVNWTGLLIGPEVQQTNAWRPRVDAKLPFAAADPRKMEVQTAILCPCMFS